MLKRSRRRTAVGFRVAAMLILVVDAGTRALGAGAPEAWRLAHGLVVFGALAVLAHAVWHHVRDDGRDERGGSAGPSGPVAPGPPAG